MAFAILVPQTACPLIARQLWPNFCQQCNRGYFMPCAREMALSAVEGCWIRVHNDESSVAYYLQAHLPVPQVQPPLSNARPGGDGSWDSGIRMTSSSVPGTDRALSSSFAATTVVLCMRGATMTG
eukprot:scaffold95058_cov30-Tisochrysis_lutea.AAC.3